MSASPDTLTDFSEVTEVPGNLATREQLSMIHTRYWWAAQSSAGKDVLEVACGAGYGLGFLARSARRVVGGDYTQSLAALAGRARRGVLCLDAQRLPFVDNSFDIILLHEALYYLPEPGAFFREALRALRPGGALLISQVNPEWTEFNRSPHSHRYMTAEEFRRELRALGFEVDVQAGFRVGSRGVAGSLVSVIRRAAVAAGLIPKTMRRKELLKRIFYGRMRPIGMEIDDTAPLEPLIPLQGPSVDGFKVLYVRAAKPAARS